MRTVSGILVIAVVTVFVVPVSHANARGGPSGSGGGVGGPVGSPNVPVRGADREATGDEIAKAKKADPAVVLKDIEESPLQILGNLNKVMLRTDGNADELQMGWTANGAQALSLWLGKTGIVRETVKALKRTLSVITLKTDQQDVSFPNWVKGHSTFLNEVVSGTGLRMVALKGGMNHELRGLQVMIDTTKPIVDEIHKLMVAHKKRLDQCEADLTDASSNHQISKALRKLDRVKRGIANLKYVLGVRRAATAGFLKIHDALVESHVTEIAQLRNLFQNPAIVKGVNTSWKKYVEDWLLHLEDTLEDCELLLATAVKVNEPFMSGDFYKDIEAFKGLKLEQLDAPVRELLSYAEVRKEAVAKSSELSAEVTALLKDFKERLEWAEASLGETTGSSLTTGKEVEEMIRKVKESSSPDPQVINELTQIRKSVDVEAFKAILRNGIAHRKEVVSLLESFLDKIADALGNESRIAEIGREFDGAQSSYLREDDSLKELSEDWLYEYGCADEEAAEIFEKWESGN